MNDDPNPFASSHQNHYSAVSSCRADRRKMSNHCLELSSIFASSKSNPRFSSTKLSNSTFFSRSANNYRGKSKLASSSSFSTFLPSLNRKCSVTRVLKPGSELADTTTKAFSPEVVGKRTDLKKMTHELVEQVIMKERPDALLPTMGGQTALNLAVALAESGALEKYGVELIGAKLDAIKKAEDRDLFKQVMKNIGLKTPPSGIGNTLDECFDIAERIGECFGFVEFGTC